MINRVCLSIAILLAAANSISGCVLIEGERIMAHDLAQAIPAFAVIPADTPLGYAPTPGARPEASARAANAPFARSAQYPSGGCQPSAVSRIAPELFG